jgi:ABC-type ATPase involved in cell division
LLTTHNKGVMDTVKGRIITMENGKIIKDDKNGKYAI